MGKRSSMVVLAALLFLFESVPVFAQSDLSAGYQFVRLSTADGASNLPRGFGIDYARSISNGWKIVGVFGWAAKHENGPLDTFSADLKFTQITNRGVIAVQSVVPARELLRAPGRIRLGDLEDPHEPFVQPIAICARMTCDQAIA